MATNANGMYSCIACNKPDRSENMVACDACKDRYHFSCATVDDNIRADNSWSCSKCASGGVEVEVSKSGRSNRSNRSVRIQLQLMKIEEERKAEEKALREKAELDKKFREQKYAVLMAEADENEGSVRSHHSRVSSRSRVDQWLLEHAGLMTSDGNGSNTGEPSQPVVPPVPIGVIPEEVNSQETPLTALGGNAGKPKGAIPKWTEPNKGSTSTPIQQPLQPIPNPLTVPENSQPGPLSPISRPIHQAIPRPQHLVSQPDPRPIEQSVTQPVSQPNPRPIEQSVTPPVSQPDPRPIEQPVPQPGLRPVQQTILQPVLQPDPPPIPKPMMQPSPEMEQQPNTQQVPQQMPQTVPQPNQQPVPKPVSQPDPLPIPKPISQPVPQPSPRSVPPSVPQSIPQPVPQSVPQSVPQPIPQPVPQSVPQSVPQPIPQPVPQSVPQSVPQPIPQPVPQTAPQSVPQPIPQPVPQSIPQSVPQPIPQPVPQQMPWQPNPGPVPLPPNFVPPHTYPTQMPPNSQLGYPNPMLNPLNVTQPIQYQAAWGHFQQQLAARQVVPKDLPIFSGNPEEWPLFISSYRNSTAMCGYSDAENLMRLQRCLKGSALEAVRSILLLPNSVPQVMATLETLFGSPDRLLQSMLNKVRSVPTPKAERLETLVNFGITVQNLVGHLKAANQQAHLMNPSLLSELVEKLPANIRLDWALFKKRVGFVDLGTFSDYMATITSAASDITSFSEHDVQRSSKPEKQKSKERAYMNAHYSQDCRKPDSPAGKRVDSQARPCYVCQSNKHRIRDCGKFKSFTPADRWKAVQTHQLCVRCLVAHGKWPCKSTRVCDVGGCSKGHNTMLHPGLPESNQSSPSGSKAPAIVSVHRQVQSSTLFRIIPVTLYGKGTQIETFAFLDEGSSLTLMDADIADQLNLDGEVQPLCLTWTANVTRREATSRRVHLQISGVSGGAKFTLENVRTVVGLDLPVQTLRYGDLAKMYPYLDGLPVHNYEHAAPRILIGLDNLRLSIPLKKRERGAQEPVATKTRLGWTVFGSIGDSAEVNEAPSFHICECEELKGLHELVESFFAEESLGISVPRTLEGEEDRRAREILERTTVRRTDGRYETGLIWRSDMVEFPPSYAMAERRLACLHRRLKVNPDLQANLEGQIEDYQKKGYAHKASQQEIEDADPKRMWFLPLGVVINPRKPGKVRMIWDAAAKVNGASLNGMLLKGPDLLTPLPKVMSRFRQREVAAVGDVREMYHQFFVRLADRLAQCFLWTPDPSTAPEIFIMDVATFGSTCSPCQAQYIKNLNAKNYEREFPEAAMAIVENHYVDDYLDSRDTEEQMTKLAIDVRSVHGKAGFEIRNWLSNSAKVLQGLGEMQVVHRKEFSNDKVNQVERVLGMAWLPDEDLFIFSLSLPEDLQNLVLGDSAPTKRKILRFIMSLYDPLGLISHVLIHGKVVIQDLWRCGVGWDDVIPETVDESWKSFANVFRELSLVRVPRCYFPGYEPQCYQTLELHTFVDASLSALACVAYFRVIDRGQPRCALVASKTKVAPLKPLSIPRLELQAALLGSRLMKTVAENHSIKITKRYIWTDSDTVLSWIRSDARKYRQYVAVRVGEILEDTRVEEWRHVPSKLNVADDGTKWKGIPDLRPTNRWFTGPDFLYEPENRWPQQKVNFIEVPEELRAVHVHTGIVDTSFIDCYRFSKWERLLRTTAYVYHFVRMCGIEVDVGVPDGRLDQDDFKKAEQALWRMAQAVAYADEINTLKKQPDRTSDAWICVEKTSPIRKLSPFIDDCGVLRMGGRIGASPFATYNAKYPVILPKNHRITELLIDWYHRAYGHRNEETVVNEIRQKYHVSNLRTEVQKVARRCQWCRVYKAQPEVPRMAPLPQERVTPYVRPFSMVGIDYFGPYLIKIGRSQVKRWVVLYTCLTIRAVHLEVASSLSAESCKLALRRFIARRGAPVQIFTDNGTNFVGVERELAKQTQDINRELSESFTNANTRWNFIPPASPHMGGAWERMVRAVKAAMNSINHPRTPSEEVFLTVLCESESMVNSRPLTYMPLETSDQEALTPNHFILLSSDGVKQTEKAPTEQGEALRSGWKLCQYMLDQFWRRWIREYLPVITRRTKWFENPKPIVVGDVVFLVDEGVRNRWIRGVVAEVFPGKDGRIRQAMVKTASGILRRPVAKLAVMDIEDGSKAGESGKLYGPGNVERSVTSVTIPDTSPRDKAHEPSRNEPSVNSTGHE